MINEYVETMKPILYLLKIIGVLPFQWETKDIPCFVASKTISLIAMTSFFLNVILNMIYVSNQFINLEDDFSFKHLVAILPRLIVRLIIFTIPFTTWSKSNHLYEYWTKWKEFQNEYETISGKLYSSTIRMKVKWTAVVVIIFTISTLILGQVYMYRGTNSLVFISSSWVYSTIFIVGAYWYTNCIYVRTVAEHLLHLGQEILVDGASADDRKLHKLISLWLQLTDLTDQFNEAHSLLFLSYIITILIAIIVFAYIVFNYTMYQQTYNVVLQISGLLGCILIIFVVCETAYSVDKQINEKQQEMLLRENTRNMSPQMLLSILCFLQIIFVKKAEINLNGFLILNRMVFPSIVAVCINYLIVLRQFQLEI